MPTTKTYQEFSSSIKAKYPQYKDIDDLELAQKMVAKYPEYKDVVQFETPKAAPTANVAPNTSLTDMDKLRLGSFPAAPMNLSLQDKPAGQFLPPAKAVQPQIYNPAQRTEDMATLYNKEVENAEAPNIRKEFIQAGESVNKGRGTAVVATEKSNEYLSNTENIADTQYDQMMTNPATYTDDNTNAIFDAMSPQKQYEEWQKNPEKWNDRPFIQNMMSTGQKETGFWGSGAGDIVQALNAGGAAVGGGLSEFMHQNIEKPLYGWMAEPNSRMIWGRIADYFFDEQEASSGAAGKENILDENGQVRQKDFVDYFKEGDYTGGFANLGIGALESAPTSAVAIGASAMGQPSVGLAVIGAQVTGTRKRELDKNNPELSEFQKNIIAYTSGAIEAGSEMLGDVPIGKMLGKIYKTGGSAVANQVMSNSVESIIKNTTKQMRNASILWKAPLSEGGEEFASGVGNYLLDSAMGIQKFNFNEMMTESGKQAVYGAVAGGGFGLVGAPGLIRNTKVASKLEGLKTEYDKANSNIQAAFADSEFEFDGEKIITLPLNQQAEILASVLQAENLTSEQKDAIQQYMQAGNGLNTALVNVGLTNIELLRKKANAVKQIENQTNEKTGTVDNITIQGSAENENYNLKSGTIILDENGKVNPQESDEAIYYFTGATNEDGTPEVNIITPENINAIQSADPKQLLQQSFMDIEAEEFIRSEFGAGMDVMLNTDMGEMPGTIVAVVPEGLVVNVQGTETIIPFKQAVQDVQVDATKEEIKAAKKTIKDFAKYTKKQYGYEKFKTDPETFISERIELLEYWNVSNQNIINNNEDEDNYDGTNKTLYEYYKKQIADNNSEIAALKEVQKSYDIVGGRKSAKKSVETKQQPTQEQPAELATRQSQVPATTYAPGTSIVVNGTTFVVGEQDENGNYAINDENGQSLDRFTPQEMADFGFSNVAVRPTQAEEQPLITEGEQETAPVTSETTPATPEAAPVQQYPITKNGEIDFDAMTVAQTYQYMVDNYGQNEANSGLSLQEKSIQGLISQNIKALDKVNASLYAQIKGAKSIQEQLKIREKNKAAITKLTAERTELDAQLAEIRSLMPKAEQTPTQPEVTATASSNVRPEEQLRREQEAERLTAEQAKVDSTEQTLTPNVDTSEQTLTPNVDTSEQTLTPEAEQQPVIEVREKKKWKGTPQWTRRINNLGDPITLEDVVLRRVAGGAKFVWSADAPHKGLSQELGFTNNPGEREARKSMIDEKNGMTPQELAHDIYESSELQFMGEVDYQDIYNAVVDTLLQVNSATAALERAEANRNKYDMMQEDYDVYTTFTQNEIDYLEQIPDEILAGYLGITNFTPEQIDFIFNIQNEYYANEQQQTTANAQPAYTSTSERSESIESTTSSGTSEGQQTELTQAELDTQELDAYIAEQAHNSNPTEKQKETGIYDKARISLQGHNITLETLKNEQRSGVDSNGKAWSITMNNHYGELDGTTGYDGDAIDVFVGPNPKGGQIFVIDQLTDNGAFDESKVMLGFDTAEEARAAYMSNYEAGWQGFGSITPAGDNFKAWLYDGKKQRKPFAEYKETPEAVEMKESKEASTINQRGWEVGDDFSGYGKIVSFRLDKYGKNTLAVLDNGSLATLIRDKKDEKPKEVESEKQQPKEVEPEATTPQAQIQQVLDNYNDEGQNGNGTMQEVVGNILTIAYDNDITSIKEAYKTYEAELREDREQFGERGDREAIENNFMKVVEQYMNGDQLPDVGNMIEKPVEARQAPKYKNGDTVYYQGKQYVVNSIYNDALAYDLETADGKPAFEEVPQSELSNQAPAPRSILDVAVEQVKKNEEKAAKVSIEKLVSENTIIAEDKKKQTIDRLNSVINKEIDNKDIVKTIEYLSDPLNEQTRSIFAQITGVKLPSTIKGSEATLREYVGLPAKEKLFLTKGEAKKAISENIGKNVFLQTGKRDWQDGRKSYPVNPSLVKIFSIDEKEVEFSYDLGSKEPTHTINIDNIRDVVVDGVSTIGDTKIEGIVKDLFATSGNKLTEQARPTIDFNNWKWEKASTNAIVIRPNTVGKPFTDEQFNTIMQWGEKNNFTPIRNSRNTRIEFVVDKLDNALVDYLDSVSVKAINDKKAADEKAKKDEAEKARKEELRNTVNSNPATSWINLEFGEDAMNDYNKNALAKFLNGDTKTFEGQVNNKWADAIARLNALTEDGKGVDWVKLKKAYEQAEVKPEVKNEVPVSEVKPTNNKVSAAQAEADAALQDFLDAFNDLNSDNLGIVDNTAEKQARMLVAGTKMVGAYTKLGLYKFADIMYQLGEKGIQITDDLLSAIKKAYGAFAAESEIDELDDMKTVRSFTLNDLQQKKNEDLTPKTDNLPKNDVSLTDQKFIKDHIIFGTIPKTNDNGQPRSTEIIESEAAAIESTSAAITNSASNVGSDKQRAGQVKEQATEQIKSVESLLAEVDNKLANLRLTDKSYSTDGIAADYPINVLAKGEIKKDLTKYIKAVAEITGLAHDTDKKGKTEIVNVNIAPAGGDATFFLWSKTNPEHGVYVSIPYDPDMNSGGWYDNYKVLEDGWRATILWRVVNRAKKYDGSNQYMPTNVTAQEMAETLLKGINAELKSKGLAEEQVQDTKQNAGLKITKTTNDNGNSKQRVLQGSNKRLSGTASPSLFDGMDDGGIGNNVGRQSEPISGTNGEQQQPAGRTGNVLPRNAELSDTSGRGRIGSREEVGTNAQGTERTGGTGVLDTPALVPFNAEDNDTQSFNQSRKYDDNIAAIETLITLVKENRKATPDEKTILSNYVGFGGLKDIVLNPESAEGWKESSLKYRAQVKRIVELATEFDQVTGSTDSLAKIKGSILNAHFTSSSIIRSVYDGVQKLGFKGGRMLEPSAGIGNFVTYAPERIKANSSITAVELDNLTGNILKYLHDDVNVKVSGIQDAQIPNNSQDLVISNVPFGNYKIFDKAFKGDKAEFQNRIHNYFFAKAVDMAREGGIIAFVTSKGVMDAQGNEALRKYLNDNTEFLGAVRLPNNAFKNNANTEVVTDIIFLKKNTTGTKSNPDFVSIKQVEATHKDGEKQMVNVNNYFVENPQNMLGNIVAGGLYSREDYTVENKTGYDLSKAIKNALPAGVYEKVNSKIGLQANDTQQTIDAIKEGNIEVTGGRVVRKEEGQLTDISINEPQGKIEHYIRLRNALMNLIYSEYLGKPDSELNAVRQQLNTEYDTFVKKHGKLSKNAIKIAKQDADGFNVLSLEVADKKDGKADIFRQRTIQPIQNKLTAESVDEAIVISLYENASIDVERIAELLNKTVPEVLQQAKGKIFEQPEGGFVTREEYLSGNVKAKLRQAQEAVDKGFTEFSYNVEQLMDVIPADIPAMHIEARLGSRWIPQEVYTEFAQYLFNTPNAKIIYQRSIDAYSNNGRLDTVEAQSKWGTARRNGTDILLDALHINPAKIYDTYRENGQDVRVLNVDETKKAVEKYEDIRKEFEAWVYKAEERRTLLARIYNEKYNTTIKRSYNGDHLNIAGINGVTLRAHQKDAIWMLLQNNGGIIDHLVGAGKTFIMVAGTMEMKRTGIAKKPMIMALKSTIPQIIETYRQAYPMAKILAPLEKDFTKDNRKKLFSQIANNEWDVIIMSHENYGKIPHEADIQRKFVEDEMREIEEERAELEAQGEKQALKGLEIRLKNLEARLQKISDIGHDNTLTFEQMGIDHIMVDESQQFKNLSYVTKQRGVAGLSKAEGSKRAFNLFIGIRYLQQKYGEDKGTTFLSGTPISNSMVEMYLLLKYLRPTKMAELGFNSFDAWATTFASPNSDIEMTVTGDIKAKTRFREFINVPELSMLYTEIADIRTDANTPLDKPKMKGGGYTVVDIKMSEDQVEYGQRLMEFARTKDGHHIGMSLTKNQETAAMLLATNLSSKMAIDMRLIDPSYSYDPNGKIGKLVDNVERIYNETAEYKGTQLIFSDLGTPKNKANKTATLRDYMEDEMGTNLDTLNEIFGNPDEAGYKYPSMTVIRERLTNILELTSAEIDGIITESENAEEAFNVYAEVKKRLVEKGVPEEQVVFIHDYNSQKAKQKLFDAVNAGQIRIVLGSTQKLGTGVNVQERVVAVHHLDVPWTPASMEQRNGRAIRQGNWVAKKHLNNELPIYAYATERTLDAYKYQLLQTKQRFLDQVKSGDVEERTVRESDGDSESGVGYAELVAMLSGNKDILLKSKLEQQVQNLTRSKRNFLSEVYEAQDRVQKSKERIPIIESNIAKTTENVETIANAVQYAEDGKMIVADINGETLIVKNDKGKVVPTERVDYGKRAVEIAKAKLDGASFGNIVKIFSQNGFDFYGSKRIESAMNNGKFGEVEKRYIVLRSKNGVEYNVTYSETPGILLNNIQKAIQGIPDILTTQRAILDKANKDVKAYQEIIDKGTEWEKEPELTKALNELKEVTKRLDDLSNDNQPKPPTDGEPVTDDKIRIGDLTFTIGKESFVTMAEAKNKAGGDVAVVRINTQLSNQDYTRRVKPTIGNYFGEWNSSNKVIMFNDVRQALNFKTTIENEFKNEDLNYEAPQFQAISPIGFYSTVEKALEAINQERGTRDQFRAMLLKNGAKQAEMDWMGFYELPEKLTKADIQNWIDENRIEVEEVEKGANEATWKENNGVHTLGEFTIKLNKANWKWGVFNDEGWHGDYFDLDAAKNFAEANTPEFDNTKFSQYVLPGGENYKELLLSMPTTHYMYDINKVKIEETNTFWKFYDKDGELITGYAKEHNPTKEDVISTFKSNFKIENKDQFKSSHFDEANILAHIRFNERTVNGERVLFIEEFQSDWAQKGKKEGFKIENTDEQIEIKFKERGFSTEKEGEHYTWIINPNGKRTGDVNNKDLAQTKRDIIEGFEQGIVPVMPFKKTDQWVNLAARRMMRYAAENGFDRIAWTNGEQQADRYDLSKQIDEISYHQSGTRYYTNITYAKAGPQNGRAENIELKEDELENYFGKEIAQKMANNEGVDSQAYEQNNGTKLQTKTLSGLDLKVGGSGMKAFYDAIVPSAMSKLGKPFGAKVENIGLKQDTTKGEVVKDELTGKYDVNLNGEIIGKDFLNYSEANRFAESNKKTNYSTQQSIPVTDSMKETAMAGLPLYHTGTTMKRTSKKEVAAMVEQLLKTGLTSEVRMVTPEEIAAVDRKAAKMLETKSGTIYGFVKNGVVYLNSTTPNLNTPIHEFGHLWIDAIEGSELYNRGAELVKNTPYWERVNADPNYSSLSEAARIKEAMAQAIGDKGEAVKRDLGLFARIKVWIADVWTRIGAKFGIQNLTPEQIQNLTFSDFVDVAVSELLSGKYLAERNKNTNFETSNNNNGSNEKTRLDNGRTVESSSFDKLVGRSETGRRIYKTIKASNNAGSTSTILTVEEREELESRGINPDFDKNIFREVLTKNASENGVLLDKSYLDDKILIHDKKANNTAENDVYLNKDKTTITKVNDLTYVFGIENHNNLSGTIDRLLSHNSLFPNVAYTIKGFIINKEGKISLVMEQPLVEAERNATRQEIEEYLTDKGFKLDGTRIWSNYSDVWSNGEYDIYDARPANVLKGKDGKLYFIDTFPHSVQYTKNLPPAKPTFKGDLGEYAFQVVQHNEEAAERTTRISKMQRLQEIMVAKSALAARHRNKEVSNQEYAKQMLALHEEKQRVMKGLPEPEPTDEDPDDNDPKPIRIIGQSVTEWATQVADWNYRQTIARALAKTASSVTGGLPPVDDDTDISGDMIRAELDQRLGGWFGRLAEAHQDNIRSVRIFQDMLKEKGTRISDFNNFYMQYTAIQGKNDAHLKDFGKRFMEAINANVLNIQKYTNYEYRDLENYVFLKHGIERNEYMRQAAAEEAVNEKLPKLTQEQIDGDIDGSLQDEYKAAYDQFLEEETAKVANKDYSGLFAVAAEIWAKQNGEAFNPKKKGDVARIQKMDEFKAERDAVIVEYIAKFEKTISETIIPTAVKGEQLTVSGFWAAINAATNYSLDRLVGSGIESKEEIDDLKARYQYYVPMRGHEVEAEKIWQYEAPDNKNVVSKAIMQASGRGSRAEHPFAYIIQMAQTSINKANRNQLNQTILRLARQDKSGLMSVSETWYLLTGTDPETGKEIWTESEPVYTDDHEYRASEVRAWNEKMTKLEGEGKARKFKKGLRIGGLFIKPKQKRQHAITVFEDGVAYQVYINGNPRVSQAINELNDKQTEIPIIPQLTRFCASMMTSRSPQFMLTNGARDLAFASTILPSKEGARYTGQFLKNYPVAMAVLANNATFDFGNNKAQYKKYLKEFEMNGGETGYSHLLELQDIQKELFKQQKGKNYLNPKTDIDAILSVIDAGNKVIENSTRLSVYITSRENGRSIERSVSDSKEVTLNFNRRGSGAMGASFIKSFFMFVNAGVQALANFGHVYKMHPIRMSATISSYAAVGFIMPMIISMIGGDDDEKEYMNMTDWERQTNLCLPTGSGFAKIPLPQEMRVFFKLGDEVYKLYSGRTEASETAIATLKSAADMIPISPLGTIASGEINDFGDLMKTLSPDAFRSIAELSANTNFMGGQIYDKYKAEKDDLPGYQKARLNRVGEARAPESIVGFTKWLDHLTGGNDVEKGGVSWNPDIVNHLAKSYLGGMYSLVAEGGKSFTKRFYTSNADIEEKNTTVKDYYKRTSEADELIRQEKGYWEQWQDGTITEAQYNAAVNQKAVDKAYEIHEYDKAITRIERILKTGELMPDDELYYKHTSDSLKREVIRIKLK